MASRKSSRLSANSTAVKEDTIIKTGTAQSLPVKKETKKRKVPAKENIAPDSSDAGPSTPKKKRVTKILPPETPTPKAIGLMSSPYNDPNIAPPAVNRLAVPNGTNAPLVSPETHRLISTKPVDQVSPSKKSNVTSTTKSLLDDAVAHLIKIEPKLKPIIEKHPCRVFSEEGLADEIDPFNSLVSGIISQQVSGAAAKSIKAKFVSLFNTDPDATTHTFPTPSLVITKPLETLRTAGLSQRKAEYVSGLAEKFHSGEITADMLFSASYEEVLAELIKVRGLGKWSVEMFACFSLKRMDVFSTGDLGVQRGMAALAGRDVGKLKAKGGKWKYMGEKEMEEIAEKFRPYRSVFMWYMWRVEDVDISTFDT
ncbi:DNA-3-methyladenine glycosylase [Lachnellula arida]|uniref:DNA-3-methyladenine glycosylase n=1 Tax=Lachnellula arida TaxID=1316785 RepID=A0A8T9BGB4_9HELO|nr:DNA-3-methyladenine glycosylase [Lachnellula arida]